MCIMESIVFLTRPKYMNPAAKAIQRNPLLTSIAARLAIINKIIGKDI